MNAPRSLGGRLLAGASVFVVIALIVAGLAIGAVLDRFIRGQIDQRLDGQLHAVASALHLAPDGGVAMESNVDAPPFDRPRSGWYWQASAPQGPLARSRSLGTDALPPLEGPVPSLAGPPPFTPDGEPPGPSSRGEPPPHARATPPLGLELDGPRGRPLHGRAARILVGSVPVVILASAPLVALRGPLRDALLPVGLALGVLGLGLILAVLLQVRLGLKPLAALQGQLAAIRQGRLDRIPDEQPSEVRPLVAELNALLALNAENLEGARRHVSNLAHGLKTPLATLSVALAGSDRDAGGQYRALVDQMDRQIRHHLSRARSAALGGATRVQTPLGPVVADLAGAFAKIHADKALAFDLPAPDGTALACDRQDLDEMLGNLLDNACRWAGARVRVSARAEGRQVVVAVEDDGPGLADDAVPDALSPGRRLDETTPGYGFGLPITRDLAELYGGVLALDRSPLGGLRATLRLPYAAQA